jgi:hypothetical protein
MAEACAAVWRRTAAGPWHERHHCNQHCGGYLCALSATVHASHTPAVTTVYEYLLIPFEVAHDHVGVWVDNLSEPYAPIYSSDITQSSITLREVGVLTRAVEEHLNGIPVTRSDVEVLSLNFLCRPHQLLSCKAHTRVCILYCR